MRRFCNCFCGSSAKQILFFVLAVLLSGSTSYAMWENNPLKKTLNINKGLSDDTVNDVLSDSKGFIWAATYKGLDRYDGHHLKHISLNDPHCLYEDADGNIWAGTSDGIYMYDVGTDRIVQVDLPEDVHSVQYYSLFGYGDGIMAQCGSEYCIELDTRTASVVQMFPSVCAVSSGGSPIYYVSHDGDILVSDDGMMTAQMVVDRNSGKFMDVRKMCIAGHYLFLCTSGSLSYIVDLDGDKSLTTVGKRIYDVLERSGGEIWIASVEGVSIVDENLTEIGYYPSSLQAKNGLPESLRALAEDYQGGVWAGTYYSGIIHLVDNPADVKVYEPEIADAHFRPRNIVEDPDGFLWVTSSGSGLYKLYPDREKLEKVRLPEVTGLNGFIAAMAISGDDLWLGNKTTTCLMDRKAGHIRSLSPDMGGSRAFLLDPQGHMWVSFDKGLYRSDQDSRFSQVSPYSYSSVMADRQGRIWATSFFFGIMKYTEDGGKVYYNVTNGNSCSYKISSIIQDDDGRIWAGTYGDGLLTYSEAEDSFVRYDGIVPKSLPVFRIMKDSAGKFWITTSQSLILFDPATGNGVSYTTEDGLPYSSFNFAAGTVASDGNIYAGSRDCIMSFSPSFMKVKPSEVRLTFTDFNLLGGADNDRLPGIVSDYDGKFTVPRGCNSFEFEVSDMNYSLPGNSYIHYKLEGKSDAWHPVEDGRLSFINLPLGNYRLTIRSKDALGEFYASEKTINFRVRPPFVLSAFMIIVYVVTLALLVVLIVIYYRRKALKDAQSKAMMDSLVRESENEKKLYASKVEFITNIAHEIKTPLSLIKLPAESLSRKFRNFSDRSVSEDVDIIYRNSERLNQLLAELLNIREFDSVNYELNPEQCKVNSLVQSVFGRFEVSARKSGIRFVLDMTDVVMETSMDRMHFDKILTNMFSNALKYAETSVSVKVSVAENKFVVTVENDGEVVPADMREKIFHPLVRYVSGNLNVPGTGLGLSISRKLAVLMGGNLYMDEDLTTNRFILALPLVYVAPQITHSDENREKELELVTERKTVLVVEDNDDMADYIARKFRAQYKVVSVSDGKQAIDYMKNNKLPSVIITDLMMPNMDGFELCRQVKKNKKTANIPVVVVSAMPEDDAKIQSLDFGADAYLEKPFSLELMQTTLNGLLTNKERVRSYYSSYPVVGVEKVGLSVADTRFLQNIQEYIIDNLSNASLRVDDLAEVSCMSKSNLLKKMKTLVSMTPAEYILKMRLKKSQDLLMQGAHSISEISVMVGFSSPSYFSQAFTREFGVYPKQYREKVAKEH